MQRKDSIWKTFGQRADAVAVIKGSEAYPDIHGRALFYTTRSGVLVWVEMSGLPTATGLCDKPVFAFHIHDGTVCAGDATDPFAQAGSHYNPDGCPHPYHAGDLPPLFGVNGRAFAAFLTNRFTLSQVLGKAVILHARPDDFTTQPAGNAGAKIACGIITPTAR